MSSFSFTLSLPQSHVLGSPKHEAEMTNIPHDPVILVLMTSRFGKKSHRVNKDNKDISKLSKGIHDIYPRISIQLNPEVLLGK